MNTEPVRLRTAQTAGTVGAATGFVLLGAQVLSSFGINLEGEQIAQISALVTFAAGILGPLFFGRKLRAEVWPDAHVQELTANLKPPVPQEEVVAEITDPTPAPAEPVYDPITGEPI